MRMSQPAYSSRRTTRHGRTSPKRRARVTVSSVLGELLVTLGVVLLAFLGWKYYLYDGILGDEQVAQASQLSQRLEQQAAEAAPVEPDALGVPIRALPEEEATEFAVFYGPTWSPDFSRSILTGTERHNVLDYGYMGAYMDSGPVGAEGNFILAGHRNTQGAAMGGLPDLSLGDHVYIETVDGWYAYKFRSAEYVTPDQVDVLNDVPRTTAPGDGERFLVLLTCNPEWSIAERLVAYFELDGFTPRADGAPEEIQQAVQSRIDNGGHDAAGVN